MITSNTESNPSVRYLLVQHVPDLFRREPKNVGVIVVRASGEVAARFFGEDDAGEIDGRKLKSFQYADVYRQWISYWRRTIKKAPANICDVLMRPNGANFNVIDAGFISGAESDSLALSCSFAYTMLVSEGGFAAAVSARTEEVDQIEDLRVEIADELRDAGILSTAKTLGVKYPVQPNGRIEGKVVYDFKFIQRTGQQTFLIEPMNLISAQPHYAKMHAVYTAAAFQDVASRSQIPVIPIAVLRKIPGFRTDELAKYTLDLLQDIARIVDWHSPAERKQFVQDRIEVAYG